MGIKDNPFHYSIGTRVRSPILLDMFGDLKNKKVLDIGFGMGYFDDLLHEQGAECTGIDLDDRCLSYCSQNVSGTFLKWDITQTPYPFPTGSFDAILCSEVLEHLKDSGAVLDEMNRLLCPSGILVASTPCSEGIFGSLFKQIGHNHVESNGLEYHWHKGFSGKSLANMIAEHGFQTNDIRYTMVAGVEIFMSITKIIVRNQQNRKINSQADSLNMLNKPLWRLYKTLFPALLALSEIERPLGPYLKGHMVIVKSIKK